MNMGKSSTITLSFLYTKGHKLEKNLINVMSVENSSAKGLILLTPKNSRERETL